MTRTKGNVIVEDMKVGDIHYEYEWGLCCKVEVLTKPVRDENGYWSWKSKALNSDRIIEYGVTEGYSHYGPNLYDYEAYVGAKMV